MGVIIGIAVGGGVALCVLLGLLLYCCRRRRWRAEARSRMSVRKDSYVVGDEYGMPISVARL